jgi:hypothetical protein
MELDTNDMKQQKQQEQQINGLVENNDLNKNNKKSDHYYTNDGVPGY